MSFAGFMIVGIQRAIIPCFGYGYGLIVYIMIR
jgi:hypothetical protein